MLDAVVFILVCWEVYWKPFLHPYCYFHFHSLSKCSNIFQQTCACHDLQGRNRLLLEVMCNSSSNIHSHSCNTTDCVTSMMTPVCCMWQALFSRQFGEVVSVTVFDKGCNADGRPVPKYGFVTFRKPEDCLKALNSRVSPAGWSSPPPFVCL